jgi:hypothetical protein
VLNKSLNFVVELEGTDAFGRQAMMGIVQAPRALPRLVRMPEALSGYPHGFVLLSSFMQHFVNELFPHLVVRSCNQFRITRNSELFVDEDEITNLRVALQGELPARHLGNAVRLEVSAETPPHLVRRLLDEGQLSERDLYRVNGPVNLVRLMQLPEMVDRPDLKFVPHIPSVPKAIANTSNLFDAIDQGDILLHHPYESFQPVLELLLQAAKDPQVVAIKQTIYRTGTDSPLMDALMQAARNGKEVTVVVELLARFDEETNINWASQLEAVGAHVVYGVVGHKCHAKMMLIVRRVSQGGKLVLKRPDDFGSGNVRGRASRLSATDRHRRGDCAASAMAIAVHVAREAHRCDSCRGRTCARGTACAHRREDECVAGAYGHRRALRGVACRREDRFDRARSVFAQAWRGGSVGEHHGPVDRRALSRASSHLLFLCERQGRCVSFQRGLDGSKLFPSCGGGVSDSRSAVEAASYCRGLVGLSRR